MAVSQAGTAAASDGAIASRSLAADWELPRWLPVAKFLRTQSLRRMRRSWSSGSLGRLESRV